MQKPLGYREKSFAVDDDNTSSTRVSEKLMRYLNQARGAATLAFEFIRHEDEVQSGEMPVNDAVLGSKELLVFSETATHIIGAPTDGSEKAP